jgi:PAS domain S-box-containing protein
MAIDNRAFSILIIEDNPGDFALVEDFLFEKFETPVISRAESYKSARTILSNDECRFDIILLDLSLPDKSREPLITEIMEICKNIPVIVLTGYADFGFGIKSLSLGVSDYILKDELTSLSLYKSIRYSSERKKFMADLEESEKKYNNLFHLSPLPAWVIDLDSLQFLDINDAAIKHYGYSRDEFLSMTIKDLRPTEGIPELEKSLEANRPITKANSVGTFQHKKKNGETMQVDIKTNYLNFKGKDARVAIATDVTERLRYIKSIEAQNKKLKEISWIQSHIVRAPLARILGLIPLIKDLTDENEAEKKKMLDYMYLSANELDDIVRDISDKTIVDEDGADTKPG